MKLLGRYAPVMAREVQRCFVMSVKAGSLRSSHGRKSSWVVEFSVTNWSRLHGGSVKVGSLRSRYGP